MSAGEFSVRLSGSNVTISDMAKAGEALRDLMQTVADETGLPVKALVGSIRRECDGCGAICPTFDLPTDWKNVDGDDLCPECLARGNER